MMISRRNRRLIPKSLVLLGLLAALLFGGPCVIQADIYSYVDANGVRHFSNIPTSKKFRMYMRTARSHRPTGRSTGRYDDLIQAAATRHKVSFPLIKAVIKAESNFNPRAVSIKGAKGLMQIMPENYRSLNIRDPFDPEENIMGGARYLRRMLTRFQGNIDLALAAYNAGPGAVAASNRIPPYAETRTYVRRVKRYYEAYKAG